MIVHYLATLSQTLTVATHIHTRAHTTLVATYTPFPHQPYLESVVESTTLKTSVSSVPGGVIQQLVLLEEVGGMQREHVLEDGSVVGQEGRAL